MTVEPARPIRTRALARSPRLVPRGLAIFALATTLSGCKRDTLLPPNPPPPPPPCDCPEPSTADPAITGDDGDEHTTFDLALETWYTPADGASALLEQEDFLLWWKVSYDWEGCEDSTPGRSGSFVLTHTLTRDGVELLDGHPEKTQTYDLKMGEEVTGSLLFKGAEIPTSPGDTLYWTAYLTTTEPQECATDDSLDLKANNARELQIYVTDCPCPGGLARSNPSVSALEWDAALGELSWQTAYAVVRCGEEDPVESGKFTIRIRVADASGAVRHEAAVPGMSMRDGAPPDAYSHLVPVEVSSGYTLTVHLDFDPDLCSETGDPTATLVIP